jgi:HK97 gp10 family phage protein
MIQFKIDQREVDKAIKQIEKIPMALRDDVRKKILRKAAQPIIQTARSKVPTKTGNLKKSIGILPIDKSKNIFVGPRSRILKSKTNGFYGRMVEYGVGLGKGSHLAGQSTSYAKPFLRPAYEQTKTQVMQIIIDGVRDALAKHLKNGSGR